MPVNTAALKTFAPAMRRQLLEAVGRKLDLLLNSQTPDTLSTYARQIAELREQEAENREQLLERVAYTWFNRLCALRYLDARSWHPFGCKVLMPAGEGETQPELLKLMRGGSLPAELKSHTNEAHLHGLLDGQIPPAVPGADPQGEVYRELVLASCRSYHQLLPDLFEGLDDASELLLPDDLLSEGSIAGGFRIAISDEDCEDVEIIGWLYQFYISEKKDQVIGKVVKSEDIPAATQLFTPNWIVKYMVQNSLGATWLATYPNSPLKGQMEFYIEPAEQTPEVQAQLAVITPESLNPEELTLIDPACGSGHILVEAYDLLKTIYLERGYRQRDIPELILTKNLYGLDICPRAAQLAAFSLLMKGREDDRRLLDRGIRLNVMALQDSSDFNDERLAAIVDLAIFDLRRADLRLLAEVFANVTTLGSLIQIPLPLAIKLPALSGLAETPNQDLLVSDSFELLRTLTRQACILAQQYSAVVANPPYMGSRMLTPLLKYHTREIYSAPKGDLYAACMIRYQSLAKERGRIGLMTPSTWMTLQSYEKLREQLLSSTTIDSFIEPELHSFFDSAYVSICTFVLSKPRVANVRSPFVRLSDFYGAELQPLKTVEAIKNRESDWMHMAAADDFSKLPGTPIVYHISERLRSLFVKLPALSEKLDLRQGMATTDNDQFLRLWHEVSIKRIGFNCQSAQDGNENGKDWFPYNKGGAFRKWYGNNSFIVLYEDDGEQLVELVRKKYPKISDPEFVIKNRSYYFRPSITWSALTVGALSLRMNGPGFIFDTKGQCGFAGSDSELLECMAFLNTKVAVALAQALAPTMDYNSGTIAI